MTDFIDELGVSWVQRKPPSNGQAVAICQLVDDEGRVIGEKPVTAANGARLSRCSESTGCANSPRGSSSRWRLLGAHQSPAAASPSRDALGARSQQRRRHRS